MKLTLSDYLIGVLYVLPVFGLCFFGLPLVAKLDNAGLFFITMLFVFLDYMWYIRVVKSEKIAEQLQNKIDELEKIK